jgi:regulator of sirC expression with transglutaminase-like and TPR domain
MISPAQRKLSELMTQSANPPLLEALFLIGEDEDPDWEADNQEKLFQQLTKGFYIPQGEEISRSIARLNIHFFQQLGFCGDEDDYYHPRNSMLHHVIERKKGLPIILSCLYMLVGRTQNLPLVPISFPGHFLVGVQDPLFFIDPFHKGRILKSEQLKASLKQLSQPPKLSFEELIEPATNLQTLVRINNNLIRAHQQASAPKGMLRSIERNLILIPEHTAAHHARYILLRGMGAYLQAAEALEIFLQHHPDHPQAIELTQELSNLRGV